MRDNLASKLLGCRMDYFESELMPGKMMFRCERLSATIQVGTCAGMWKEGNGGGAAPERLMRCRGCAVGAGHAGEGDASGHALRGTATCARCERSEFRLIGGNVCVSCRNREYEWVKGKNAKGGAPVRHPKLERGVVRYVVGGVVKRLARDRVTGTSELVVELLRDSPKRVLFGFGIGGRYGS